MDTNAREQIRLILDHLTNKSQTALNERVDHIYSQHSAAGRLQSGFTVKVALRALEASGEQLLNACVDQVGAIAKNVESFALIHLHLEKHIRFLELKLADVVRTSGQGKHGTVTSSVSREAKSRMEGIRSNLTRQIDIHRFTFNQPLHAQSSDVIVAPPSVSDIATPAKNPGGKPLAKHWDAMWAAIAFKLYAGDIQPSSQADIERAMKDWFAENNLDIGDTAIRGRARTLWTKIQATE